MDESNGLLTGGLIAIAAFLLAVTWDVWKSWRDRRRRDRAVLEAARAELASILAAVRDNQTLINKELAALSRGTWFVDPLQPVESGFWDLVKLDPPAVLLRERTALAQIRDVSRRTDQVAEMIRSREAFRIANQALESLHDGMTVYDQLLEQAQRQLLGALHNLSPVLDRAAARLDSRVVRLPRGPHS